MNSPDVNLQFSATFLSCSQLLRNVNVKNIIENEVKRKGNVKFSVISVPIFHSFLICRFRDEVEIGKQRTTRNKE